MDQKQGILDMTTEQKTVVNKEDLALNFYK